MNKQNWVLICALKPEWHLLKKKINFSKIEGPLSIPCYQAFSHSKNIFLYQIGVGYQKADGNIDAILKNFKSHIHLIIHFGFSGGLISGLNPGDLFLPLEVTNHLGDTIQFDPILHQKATQLLKKSNLNFMEGRLLTTAKVLTTPQEKEEQGITFKSQAVDMETFPVAQFCLKNKIPFLSLRSIFDPLEWDLSDLGKERIVTTKGEVGYGSLAKQIIQHPRLLMNLPKYQASASKASQALACCLVELINYF